MFCFINFLETIGYNARIGDWESLCTKNNITIAIYADSVIYVYFNNLMLFKGKEPKSKNNAKKLFKKLNIQDL